MRWAASSIAGSGCTMFELAWPWMLILLPLPIVVWWLLPPYRARQASVQIPFFDRMAAATGQTPQRGAVVLQRRTRADDRGDPDLDTDRRGARAAAMGRRRRDARDFRPRSHPGDRYLRLDGAARLSQP